MWSPRRPSRSLGDVCVVAALIGAAAAWGQSPPTAGPSPSNAAGGEGEVALQGYYMGGNSQPFINTTGTAFHFQEFLPGIGLFSGNLEGYGAQNRFQSGLNFLELRGAPRVAQVTGGTGIIEEPPVPFPWKLDQESPAPAVVRAK